MNSQRDILERKIRTLQVSNWLLMATVCVCVLWTWNRTTSVVAAEVTPELRVKRLVVVDGQGTERVIISAPVPDPMIGGKRVKREGAASGIILYDRDGNERGGYLTSDMPSNGAMLTLDGTNTQVLTLYANPDNGATLSLNNQKGDGVTLTTWNRPVLQMRQGSKIFFKQPTDAPDLH